MNTEKEPQVEGFSFPLPKGGIPVSLRKIFEELKRQSETLEGFEELKHQSETLEEDVVG